MLVTNYTDARNKLKEYCDKVCDNDEVIIITRKDNRHVALISFEQLNKLISNNPCNLVINEDVKADNIV